MDNIQIALILGSTVFLLFIFELTRKKKIREEYSLAWFLAGFILLVFSVFRNFLDYLAELFGVVYAPALIIPIIIFLGLLLGIHISIVLSTLTENNKNLIQEVGLLKNRIRKLEDALEEKNAAKETGSDT